MFIHNINPVLLDFGAFQIRYYGLFIVISLICIYFMLLHLAKKKHIDMTKQEVQDFVIWFTIGILAGSRIIYVFVYNFSYYSKHMLEALFFWQGGLSFHGGVIGLFIAVGLFAKVKKKDFWQIGDLIAIPIAIGLFLGRIANFFNAELVGRVTDVPWAVNFNGETNSLGELVYRHPSQLYESAKNLFMLIVLWFLYNTKKFKKGTYISLFLLMYSVLRFTIGFFRAPDPQIGYLIFGFTMGQLLNMLMFVFAIGLMVYVQKKND